MANRICIGNHDSLDDGLFVSKPGKNANSETGINLIFNSNSAHGGGTIHDIIDISCSSSAPYSGSSSFTSLGYIPFVHITELTGNDGNAKGIGSWWGRSTGGGSGNMSCLLTGTMIKTPVGDRPIEEIWEGDRIIGYDLKNQKEVETSVVARSEHITKDYYIINGLKITGGHPIWTEKGWACVEPKEYYRECQEFHFTPTLSPLKLEIGDTLFNGEVEQIEYIEGVAQVFNIEVANTHNYFAGEKGSKPKALIHNGGGQGGPGGGPGGGGGGGGSSGGRSQLKASDWRATVTATAVKVNPWYYSGSEANISDWTDPPYNKSSLVFPGATNTSGKYFRAFIYKIAAT